MHLESARNLKASFLSEPLGTGAIRRSLTAEIHSLHRAAGVPVSQPYVFALGIKGRRSSYKLAVRVQTATPGIITTRSKILLRWWFF